MPFLIIGDHLTAKVEYGKGYYQQLVQRRGS